MRRTAVAVILLALGQAAAAVAATYVSPIPSTPATPVFAGKPATPAPVTGVARTPRNPFMAPNGRSEIHDDAWQTNTYSWSGPLGRRLATASNALGRDCGSITFDRRGRVVSICVGAGGPVLYMLDPRTLATLASFTMPARQSVLGNIFQDFTGGGYFYLDAHDRVVTATTTHHIWVIAENAGAPGFHRVRDYDLTGVLTPAENITSALPDSKGLLWFVTRTDGVVGTIDSTTGATHVIRLGQGALGEIENSFATGIDGDVYIATNRELYRFAAGNAGAPRIVWQAAYPNGFVHKPGQVDDGTGTTPTVMPGGYVAITDNADPMDVVVYRTALHPSRTVIRHGRLVKVGLPRTVCRVPVFDRGASDTENSLIGTGRALIVENNYGYTGPGAVTGGKQTVPGFARVDINPDGMSCHRVWTNRTLAAPTVVPKLSLASGLIYTYTKGTGPTDPWYWTALDFRTGKLAYKRLAGAGAYNYNNNYAGIAISRAGAEYLGVLDGVIAIRDGGF